jgi:hypothetical protein
MNAAMAAADVLEDPEVRAALRKMSRGRVASGVGDDQLWYIAMFGPSDAARIVRLVEAEASGRSELDRTLDMLLMRAAEDDTFYVVIRRSRLHRTGNGLVEIRPADDVPEVLR